MEGVSVPETRFLGDAPEGSSSLDWRDLVRDVLGSIASRAAVVALGVAGTVLVARVLGPDGRGAYAVAVSIAAVGIQFAILGFSSSNTFVAARQPESVPALIGNSLFIAAAAGGVAAALVGVYAWSSLEPQGPTIALAIAVSVPLGVAATLLQAILLGMRRVAQFNSVDIVNRGSVLLVGLGVVALHVAGVGPFVLAFAIGSASSLLAAGWALRRSAAPMEIDFGRLARDSRYGFRAYLAATLMYLVLRVDILIVASLAGQVAAGFYATASSLADLVYLPAVVLGSMLFPRLAQADHEAGRRLALRAAALTGVAMTGAALFAAITARPAVLVMFGGQFEGAVLPFLILLPAVVLLSINTILMNYFAARGMPLFAVVSPAAAAVANIAMNLVLVPRLGAAGASAASIVSYGLLLCASIWYLRFRDVRAG